MEPGAVEIGGDVESVDGEGARIDAASSWAAATLEAAGGVGSEGDSSAGGWLAAAATGAEPPVWVDAGAIEERRSAPAVAAAAAPIPTMAASPDHSSQRLVALGAWDVDGEKVDAAP